MDTSNPHDAFFKDLFTRLDVAADFLARYLRPEIAAQLDLTRLELVKGSFVDDELQAHFADMVYRVPARGREGVYVCLLLEHKSAPDKWVSYQILSYIMRLWGQAKTAGAKKLPRVFPLVIYHGKRRWTVKPNLAALIETGAHPAWRKFIPDFEYQLFDLSDYNEQRDADAQLLLRLGLSALKHIFDKDLAARLDELWALAKGLPYPILKEYTLTLLRYLAYAPHVKRAELEQSAKRQFPELARGFMTIAETLKQEGLRQGLQQGLQQGRQQEAAAFVLRQLHKLLGAIEEDILAQIRSLPVTQLEQLGEDLLNFRQREDLTAWLETGSGLKA
jgi:predicted transposase/invertase (TIGR01784 family)